MYIVQLYTNNYLVYTTLYFTYGTSTEHLRNMESSALYGMYYVQKVENGPLSYEALATSAVS